MTTTAPTGSAEVARPAAVTGPAAPVHVVPGPEGHGVDLCARQLAAAVGATVVPASTDADRRPAHLHVTDRVWGDSPEQAARRVVATCRQRPTTLTLHDLPQPHDGPVFTRRSRAYAEMVRAAAGVVVSSEHERGLLAEVLAGEPRSTLPLIAVVPLPLVPGAGSSSAGASSAGASSARASSAGTDHLTLGIAGWFYPGKGHLPALGAALAQRRRGRQLDVRVLGAPSPGHADDAADLTRRAARLGVRLEVTGWLTDDELATAMRTVDVPFVGHRNVSASGSLNSWLVAGRRPLVRRSPYFEEMGRLRPGTLRLVRTGDLAAAVGDALDDPAGTWLGPDAELGHDLDDAAQAYRRFWARAFAEPRRRPGAGRGAGRVA